VRELVPARLLRAHQRVLARVDACGSVFRVSGFGFWRVWMPPRNRFRVSGFGYEGALMPEDPVSGLAFWEGVAHRGMGSRARSGRKHTSLKIRVPGVEISGRIRTDSRFQVRVSGCLGGNAPALARDPSSPRSSQKCPCKNKPPNLRVSIHSPSQEPRSRNREAREVSSLLACADRSTTRRVLSHGRPYSHIPSSPGTKRAFSLRGRRA